jgi:hypothetical protein
VLIDRVNPWELSFASSTEANTKVIYTMKELFQAVDIKKWGSKIISSAVIVSLLMIDVANAIEPEDDPRSSSNVHSSLSLKLPPAGHKVIVDFDDFSHRHTSGLDEADSSTGSISASPEKLTPEGDKSLAIIPLTTFSLAFSQSNDVSPPQPLDALRSQPSPLLARSDPTTANYPQFQLSSSMGKSMGNSIGSSPMAASLQERSPPFILPSQSVAESSYNNDQPAASAPANIPRSSSVWIVKSKRNLSSAPASGQPSYNESSRLLDPALSPRYYSIQAEEGRDDPSPSTAPLGDPEDHDLPAIEDNSKCCSWWPDRPLWPEPTKCALPDPLNAIKKRSEFFLSSRPNHQAVSSDDSNDSLSFDESDSSSPHESPPKAGAGVLPSSDGDSDDSEIAFDIPTHPAITDNQSLINLQSPVDAPIGAPRGAPVPPAHLSVLLDPDLESGDLTPAAPASHARSLSLQQSAWKDILDGLKDLSPTIKTQLTNFTHQILKGETTWPERIGKWLIGPIIGLGFAIGMGPVYGGGILYLDNLSEAFNEFWRGNVSGNFALYINYSAGPDGISRNAHLLKKGIGYLFQENKEVGRMCIAGAIAAATALIPVAYLILAENFPREEFQLPNWDNQFGIAVVALGPPLYIDAFAKDFEIAWKTIPKLEDWCRQARELFFPSSFPPQIKSFEAIQREKFDGDLKNLQHFLGRASGAVIEAIYKDVQDVIAGARSEVDLAAQQAFATVSYLLSLGDEVQEVAKKNAKKSIAEIAFDGLKYTCLILGAPTTALLLELVGSTFASLFTSNGGVADSIGGGFALVAFLPFTYVLVQSMDSFKNLIFSKDPRGHESHPAIRLPVKVFIGIQSFIYLFQTSVAVLQGYQKWFGDKWWPFAAAAPFLVARSTGFLNGFNETFNEQVTTSAINAYHKIGGKCRGNSLCTPCQKDWLIRFIESSRSDLEHWNPELIHNLTKGIEIFKDEEANSSFDEI